MSVSAANFEIIDELEKAINLHHNIYIREDCHERKNEAWTSLQESARKYLFLVAHNRKFKFNETERVLHQSATSDREFNPKDASYAFECLAKYAHNLISQPWREEFHYINITSGFYVHNIAAHLRNAQEILIAMGYVNISDKSLKLVPNFDLATIKSVSRDCLLASQECFILHQIWEQVYQISDCPLTVDKLYEFRCKNKGDIVSSCTAILDDTGRNPVKMNTKGDSAVIHQSSGVSSDKPRRISVISDDTAKEIDKVLLELELDALEGKIDDDHFYDLVSSDDLSQLLRTPTEKSKQSNKNFSTSTPVQKVQKNDNRDASNSIANSEESYHQKEEEEDFPDGPSNKHTSISGDHVYSNVPLSGGRGCSKSSLAREKTKWHTPMKYKLRPQAHLWLSKLSERECSSSLEEMDFMDLKAQMRDTKATIKINEKVLETFEDKTLPRTRNSKSLSNTRPEGRDVVRSSKESEKEDYNLTTRPVALNQHSRKSMPSLPSLPMNSNYEVDTVKCIPPEYPTKLSNSESSYSGGGVYVKCGSSTEASSWDRKIVNKRFDKAITEESDHYYDEPNNSDDYNSYDNRRRTTDWFGQVGTDFAPDHPGPSHHDPSIGFGFGAESPIVLQSPPEKLNLNRKSEKLNDLEDVWFNALLMKEGNLQGDCVDEGMEPDYRSYSAKAEPKVPSKFRYDNNFQSDRSFPRDRGQEELEKRLRKLDIKQSTSLPLAGKKEINARLNSSMENRFEAWTCKVCTFNNSLQESVCEICCKSKDYVEEDEDSTDPYGRIGPSSRTGRKYNNEAVILRSDEVAENKSKPKYKVCPQCTLRNDASVRVCEACQFRLRDFNSPSRMSWLELMN